MGRRAALLDPSSPGSEAQCKSPRHFHRPCRRQLPLRPPWSHESHNVTEANSLSLSSSTPPSDRSLVGWRLAGTQPLRIGSEPLRETSAPPARPVHTVAAPAARYHGRRVCGPLSRSPRGPDARRIPPEAIGHLFPWSTPITTKARSPLRRRLLQHLRRSFHRHGYHCGLTVPPGARA